MALEKIGSIQNITLTRLARNRRVLFTEGASDFQVIRQVARHIGLLELAAGNDLTTVESEGFTTWERIRSLAWGIEKALGSALKIGIVLDHDYFCDEELDEIRIDLSSHLKFIHIHSRKEIENYLLIPSVLQRAVDSGLSDAQTRRGKLSPECVVSDILASLTDPIRSEVQSQYIAKRAKYFKGRRDEATINKETIDIFDSKWSTLETRMHIVPGKEILASLRSKVQEMLGITLSTNKIIRAFRRDEIPLDFKTLVQGLERFRNE